MSRGHGFNIISKEDGTEFHAVFADQAAIVTDGYGGWNTVARPRDIALTEWQGRNPISVEIPFMIDFWMEEPDETPGVKCENQVKNLEKLAGIHSNDQPPICRIQSGGAIPHGERINNWVIDSITWDRSVELRNRTTHRRLRCGGTIVVRQFMTSADIFKKIRKRHKAKIYRTKKGDTLTIIAKKFYGDSSKWKIIGDANHMKDRRKKLKVNTKLKIPWRKGRK